MQEHVILVDHTGREIGTEEKIQAHQDGKLHRAFSIFVFNTLGEVLLQKRAETKYHSGGLWTNTCCSHPRPGENHHQAARRRLHEEMGFDCELQELFNFIYHVKLNDDLFEHELDRVFVGHYDGQPAPNPDEVDDWKWMNISTLKQDVQENPDNYTYWFKLVLDRVIKQYEKIRYHDEV
ncbi:isopentenyl-diphosphate Delta-isomerase [Candidatus Poribacteria bacterium]|nr:isopentenyl-diphosphate Delta-isomerase [Candidatus Poribacteria bacterium]